MERELPKWCKEAKTAMIWKNLSYDDLAQHVGFTRQYVSSVLNGRVYSEKAVKKISDFLNINDNYCEAGRT
jgi:cyanate lyase